jgi:hypothetical protein
MRVGGDSRIGTSHDRRGIHGRPPPRVYDEMPDVEPVGTADTPRDTVEKVSRLRYVRALADCRQLLDQISPEIVRVAGPTADQRHRQGTNEENQRLMPLSSRLMVSSGRQSACLPCVLQISSVGGEFHDSM